MGGKGLSLMGRRLKLFPYVACKDTVGAVRTAIGYIDKNSSKHRIDAQPWRFVVPYNNWPFHKRRPKAP